ncbi:MAG: anaerobic glycerol-3-phosphate dehydrogenase subunit C [Chloroflexi bacterium]|nr:anaerobic glycerol-3-phosphate dehydrogenase subunit C [Chloroflexota bacterium]
MSAHPPPVEMSLDQCIKCNICTTACPVSAVTDLFPGPKYAAPQAGRFRAPGQPTPDHSVDYCSGCRVCNMVCPTGVRIAEMNARARAVLVEQGKTPPLLRLRNNLIARAGLLGQAAQPVAPLANAALSSKPLRVAMEKTLHIHRDAPLPPFASQRFTAWFKRRPRPDAPLTRQAAYFHGCSTEYYEPRIGRAVVRVLEHNGFEVLIPRQNCCGLPLLSNGEFPAARKYHEGNLRGLLPYAQQGIPIVGASTSCTLTLKEEAPELLDMHGEDARLVAEGVFDLNEFLLNLWEAGELRTDFRPLPMRLPYHPPCQYRAHRLGKLAIELLSLIPGLRLEDSHAACCGIAGTYGYKEEKYPISMQVGKPLFEFVSAAESPFAVCDSETCRWQITHATGKPAVHPVELLAVAYGFPPEGALAQHIPAEIERGSSA